MFAIQYNASNFYKASLVPTSIEDLSEQLQNLAAQKDTAEKKVSYLNQQLENKRNSNTIMSNMQKDLQRIKMAGGLYPCQGPGLSITMSGESLGFQTDNNKNGSKGEADDLLGLINELKASGAEAIAVNEQRITARTEVSWTGTMIVINGHQVRSPYQILVIGNPDNLESGLLLKGGYLYNLQQSQISFKKQAQIIVPAFDGPTQMTYAKPVK